MQDELGERTSDLLGFAEEDELAVDDLGVDLFGDLDEWDGAMQDDQRNAETFGLAGHGLRDLHVTPAQGHDHAGDAGPRELGHVPPLLLRIRRQAEPRREQELRALEQRRHVRDVGDVHPPDRLVEGRRAGDHLRLPALDRLEVEHVSHRQRQANPRPGRKTTTECVTSGLVGPLSVAPR